MTFLLNYKSSSQIQICEIPFGERGTCNLNKGFLYSGVFYFFLLNFMEDQNASFNKSLEDIVDTMVHTVFI